MTASSNSGRTAPVKKTADDAVSGKRTEVGPGDESDWLNAFDEVVLTTGCKRFERFHEPTGRWYNVFVAREDDASPPRLTALVTDITDRKRAEVALRESEERYRHLSDIADIGLVRNSRDLVYLSANPAYARIVGKPLEEIVGRPLVEVLGVSGVEAIRPYVERSLGGERVSYQLEVPLSRVGSRWLHVGYEPDVDASGQIVGWVGSVKDITDQRLLELSLRERTALAERVAKSEERLRAVIDGVGDAIITFDANGVVSSINRSGTKIFGYEEDEIAGRNVRTLMNYPHISVDEDITHHLETRQSDILGKVHEAEGRHKNGSSIPIELAISEANYEGARLFVAIARDLSAQRKAEAEVETLRTERISAIGGIAVALAHEVNQPFLATVAYLHCAQSYLSDLEGRDADKAREALGLASDSLLRAGQIIKHLREFTSSGEPDKTFQRLNAVVRLAVAERAPALIQDGIEVSLHLDVSRDRVLVDVVQINQVLVNLMRNAAQAMKPVTLRRLTISTEIDGDDRIRVKVADTGIGLSDKIKERLFEPFNTTKEGGMGIGLAISRSIIEAHYGTLTARPCDGGGTIFSIILPLEGEIHGRL